MDNSYAETSVKPKRTAVILMGLMALAFSYIIMKEVVLPPMFLIIGALIGGIVLLGMGMNRPEVVTYVLVAYLPFSKVLAGSFGGFATAFNLTNLLMAFIFIVWMTGRYSKEEPPWLSTPLNFPILLFMVLGAISVVRGSYYGTGYFWPAFTEFKRWTTPILLFFLVLNTVKERDTIKNIVVVIMIVTMIVALMAIYDYLNVGPNTSLENSRVGGISGHSNTLAAFFNYYMFLFFGFFLMNMGQFRSWLLLIPFLTCFRGIMVTFSRGGYVSFGFAMYSISFFRSKLLFMLLLVLTWFAMMNPAVLPAGVRFRMAQTFEKNNAYVDSFESAEDALDASAKNRVEIWKGGIKMIEENPIFGVGYGLFHSLIPYYWTGGYEIDAHNTYLILAAEMGIPALLIFLLIILLTFIQTYGLYRTTEDRFAKGLALGFIGGLFGLLMSNMFGSRLDSQEVSSYFWILAAIILRLKILDQRDRERKEVQEEAHAALAI